MEIPHVPRALGPTILILCLLGCPGDSDVDDDTTGDDDTAGDDDSSAGDDDSTGEWRSELYPLDWIPGTVDGEGRFLHDFSYAGYHLGEAALPSPPPPVADVTDFGADAGGGSDSTAAIQAAIDSLPDGGTVLLPEGSYRCDGVLRVENSGVVIVGEGTDLSLLWFTLAEGMEGASHLTFSGAVTRGPDLLLAEDGENLSHRVRVDDASSLSAGDEVSLGWFITDEFVDEHGMTGTWEAFNGNWRPFFRRQVEAVDTSVAPHEVWLDVPLRYPARVRDGASLRAEEGYLRECGVQDLSVSTVVHWSDAWSIDRSHAIRLQEVADCWVAGLGTFESPHSDDDRGRHLMSGGLLVADSKRVTVADSHLAHPQNRGSGGNGYLFEIDRSNEVLTRDCRATAGRHNFIQNWDFGTAGCVWLRTTSTEGWAALTDSELLGHVGFSEYHHSLAMANLVDDSTVDDGWQATNRHDWSTGAGVTSTEGVFWNMRGAGVLRSYNYGWGYVIGTQGLTVEADIDDDGLFSDGEGTEPNDWLEGLERGDDLRPVSLYEDQLALRLGR